MPAFTRTCHKIRKFQEPPKGFDRAPKRGGGPQVFSRTRKEKSYFLVLKTVLGTPPFTPQGPREAPRVKMPSKGGPPGSDRARNEKCDFFSTEKDGFGTPAFCSRRARKAPAIPERPQKTTKRLQKASKGPRKEGGRQDAHTRNENASFLVLKSMVLGTPSFYPGRARKAPRTPPKGPKSHQKA